MQLNKQARPAGQRQTIRTVSRARSVANVTRCRAGTRTFHPADLLTNGGRLEPQACLSAAQAAIQSMESLLGAAADRQMTTALQVWHDLQLLHFGLEPVLALLARRHPDPAWAESAAEAWELLDQEAARIGEELCGRVAAVKLATGDAPALAADVFGSAPAQPVSEPALRQLQQLAWGADALLQATRAAAGRIMHDASCSPLLLLSQQQAHAHPVWARDWQLRQQQQQQQLQQQQQPAAADDGSTPADSSLLAVLPPATGSIEVGAGVALPVAAFYGAAASAPSTPADAAPFALTAAAAAALLASPPGLLPPQIVQQVADLGVVCRLQALATAVDVARATWAEQQQLQAAVEAGRRQLQLQQLQSSQQLAVGGSNPSRQQQQLLLQARVQQQLEQLRPQQPAACAAAAAHALSGSAVGEPAVAAAFLRELLACCRAPAAEEVRAWLELCRPLLDSSSSGPDFSELRPHQAEGVRQLATITEAERVSSLRDLMGPERAAARPAEGWDDWLSDYTALPQLLSGCCELFGGWLQLDLAWSPAAPGSTWAQEAFVITVTDASRGDKLAGRQLGQVLVLVDDAHAGMPATQVASHGGYFQAGSSSRQQQQPGPSAFQQTLATVTLPGSFSSSSSSVDASSSSSSSAVVLANVCHELGHALQFVLSAGASGAGLADCCCWGHAELTEVAAHLTERLARDPRCLQVLLRHRRTGRPPPVPLTRRLATHIRLTTRGAYQWQQHLMAALTDAELAAAASAQVGAEAEAAAAGCSSGAGGAEQQQPVRCWDVLAAVIDRYEPLQQQQQQQEGLSLSPALLTYMPALAAMPPGHLYCYIHAELVAAAVWRRFGLDRDPTDPAAGRQLRLLLFEASGAAATQQLVHGLLGPGSMRQLAVPADLSSLAGDGGGRLVQGWVLDLTHPVFEDIDLWA